MYLMIAAKAPLFSSMHLSTWSTICAKLWTSTHKLQYMHTAVAACGIMRGIASNAGICIGYLDSLLVSCLLQTSIA
jgi:hypothetical protein